MMTHIKSKLGKYNFPDSVLVGSRGDRATSTIRETVCINALLTFNTHDFNVYPLLELKDEERSEIDHSAGDQPVLDDLQIEQISILAYIFLQ